ncbi:MAG: sulfotransferase family protein [Chloroflexota bacterium]
MERQIFIGGCSRSGTTLLGAILGAHADCVCPPESHFKVSVVRSCRTPDGGIDVERALRLIRIHWRFKLWGMDVDPGQAPTGSYAELLDWLVDTYARRRGIAAHVWIDHTPENINYGSVLLELFPQATIVHIIRDGRAVANSILPLDWGPNTVIRAASWWQANVREGLALEGLLPPSQIVRVKYEDLVRAPEETVRRLCRELDLRFEPHMLQADGFRPPTYTASQHELIGMQPDPERATRWKKALTPRQVELFESLAGGLLGQLGYRLLYGPQARPPTALERAAAGLTELVRGDVVNGVRWFIRSYPLWVSWDFLRVLPDTWESYHKMEVEEPVDAADDGQAG